MSELDAGTVSIIAVIGFLAQIVGLTLAVHAVMSIRRAQSAVAWTLGLVGLPTVAIPLYVLFGRVQHFHGYVRARTGTDEIFYREAVADVLDNLVPAVEKIRTANTQNFVALEKLAPLPFTGRNDVRLLINGTATFEAIFQAIEEAQHYIYVVFYIYRDDNLGRRFREALMGKARAGVHVYLLYDEMGSYKLSHSYFEELERGGVVVSSFNATQGPHNILHINFRNHRKIVIADGKKAYVGGHNVGDEYLGHDPKWKLWRDTHIEVTGPAVMAVQLAFVQDWYWASRTIPVADWTPEPAPDADKGVLVLPDGPADKFDTTSLMFLQMINSAKERLWIVSPYFVPEPAIIKALQLAAMRGVDVRVMLPERPDHLIVWLASFTFFEEAQEAGVRVYRYQAGFLHQKVALVDTCAAAVGTANLDSRSLRLNFEIMILVEDAGFAAEVAQMLEDDFAGSRFVESQMFEKRPVWFRFAARLARLFSPLL